MVGDVTVQGQVVVPVGSPAPRSGVYVLSQNPGFGRGFGAQTDLNGFYSVGGVPVGNVVVTANGQGPEGQLFAQNTGTLLADGATATVNLLLAATNLFDASDFS